VQFLLVYIREAHALDSDWPITGQGAPLVEEPVSLEERQDVAQTCVAHLDLGDFPVLVDGIDDAVSTAYEAWPDRLYLVGKDGRIVFKGERGPAGFDPEALEQAIVAELSPEPVREQEPELEPAAGR
jgi:hypothetical protein